MHENTRKSFYIFLSSMLGVLLFLMLQRSVFLIAFLLGVDIGSVSSQALGIVTTAIAVVFGAWYGVWLGLVWYSAVYEEGTVRGMLSSLAGSFRGRRANADAWDLDDLVLLGKQSETQKPETSLVYFEKNTVQFGGEPISARAVHTQHIPISTRKRTVKTGTRRKQVAKSTV